MRRLLALLLLTASTAWGQDVLTLGSDRASAGGSVQLPVTISSGGVQSIAFKVMVPEMVASVSFTRTAAATALYERTLSGSGWISYVAMFQQPVSGQLGRLDVTLSPNASGTIPLRFDAPSVNLGASTVANATLALANGSITVASVAAPAGLVATATSASAVTITWSAVSGADGYEVWRNGVLLDVAGGPAYGDTTVSANTSYLYRVRALSGGDASGFSNADVATTVVFDEDTIVRAAHVTQLRTAVNAMRSLAGLGELAADATIGVGQVVRASHITALRTGSSEARAALGLPALSYTDATLTIIKEAHVTELRSGVR